MKYASALLLILLFAAAASSDQVQSFNVRSYGSFRKIIETKNPEGVVGLEQALSGPHTYAVGELKNAEGEVTVYNGEVWLNYGGGGINFAVNEVPRGEQAMQLISAQVDKWQDLSVSKNMSDSDLYRFVLDEARKTGLDVKNPFPFIIEGDIKDLVWHVLNGSDIETAGNRKKIFFTRLVEYRQHAPAILIGFCSETQDGFTFPGELWHTHILLREEKTAGHLDAFSVSKGTKLRLPVKPQGRQTGRAAASPVPQSNPNH